MEESRGVVWWRGLVDGVLWRNLVEGSGEVHASIDPGF